MLQEKKAEQRRLVMTNKDAHITHKVPIRVRLLRHASICKRWVFHRAPPFIYPWIVSTMSAFRTISPAVKQLRSCRGIEETITLARMRQPLRVALAMHPKTLRRDRLYNDSGLFSRSIQWCHVLYQYLLKEAHVQLLMYVIYLCIINISCWQNMHVIICFL